MAFSVYPAVSLAQARTLRDEAKKKLAEGIAPSFAKKEEKLVRDVQLDNTFQQVALEWHGTKVSRWSEGYASDIIEAFNKNISSIYVRNQWDVLCYYSDDGLAEPVNNAAERALRAVCLEKKNYIFFGSA
ncbi:transposase IS66 family protein [Kosakonia sp. AG348]|nr:transposase IS66 family protein [Kosakonia sp. AG348]